MAITSPRSSAKGYLPPPVDREDEADHRKLLAQAIAQILQGKLNVAKSVTLSANATSTTITDPRIGTTSVLILIPTTANAAAEWGNGTIYQTYPNATAERAVINHANDASTDRTYACVIIG